MSKAAHSYNEQGFEASCAQATQEAQQASAKELVRPWPLFYVTFVDH